MPKKIKADLREIVWNANAHTVVRSSQEPYDIKGPHEPNKVDPNHHKRGYNSHAVVDEQTQR